MGVFLHHFIIKMLPSIDLNNKFGFCAAEINDEVFNDSLSVELKFRCTKEVIPQMLFLFGHVLAKFTRVGFHVFRERLGHEWIIL